MTTDRHVLFSKTKVSRALNVVIGSLIPKGLLLSFAYLRFGFSMFIGN